MAQNGEHSSTRWLIINSVLNVLLRPKIKPSERAFYNIEDFLKI